MPPAKKKPKTNVCGYKFEPDRYDEYVDTAVKSHTDASMVIDNIRSKIVEHGSLYNWFAHAVGPNEESQKAYALALHTAFPPIPDVIYLSDAEWGNGLTCLQLWNCGIRPTDGFSEFDDRALFGMISIQLANGLQTDPAEPGIEAISIRKVTPGCIATLEVNDVEINTNIKIASVGFVKGKKRIHAALAIALVLVDQNYDTQTNWPQLWQSLRKIHATVGTHHLDDEAAFLQSMSIGVNSSATRTRPPVFAWAVNIATRFGKISTVQKLCWNDSTNSAKAVSCRNYRKRKRKPSSPSLPSSVPSHVNCY